jgi:signal transduction histidine kinase
VTGLRVALAVVWVVAVSIVALVDSVASAALTGGLLILVGLLAVQAAHYADRRRAGASLDRQITVGAALSVVQMVVAAGLFAGVMFFSTHDAILIVLVSAFAGVLGLLTARMTTRRLVADVRAVRDGLVAVGAGSRDTRIETEGSSDLVELADAANTMTGQLAAGERARRNLVAAISHDLRTPLTSMRLVVDALDDEILESGERGQYLGRLRLHIDAMQALIEDLFELSRLEAGDTSWSLQLVDLAMLVGDTVDAMQPDAGARPVRIVVEIPEDLAPVRGNPEKLQRVLFNLLQNAIRHSPPRGVVSVRAEQASEHVEVEIADEGAGIPEDDRATVFDAFVQAGDRAARGEGAGLGLAIARAIVLAHEGRIWLADAERGTRLRFSVPRAARGKL